MIKINLYDKFFYSPNWTYHNRGELREFENILQSGYILSSRMLGKKPRFDGVSERDKVYLSVHPLGEFASEFIGKSDIEYDNCYKMTIEGQYFILSSEFKKDNKPEPGKYDCECTVLDQVDLYKYLVGIGNAGLFINDDLILCFNFIKYFNGMITEDELINIIRERHFKNISERTRGIINRLFTPCYNYLSTTVSKKANSFIEIGNYYHILEILDNIGKNISLYDKYGYAVDPVSCLAYVNEMIDYIGTNLNILERNGITDVMHGLLNRLREKERNTK